VDRHLLHDRGDRDHSADALASKSIWPKNYFVTSIVGFTLASIFCGAASDLNVLIAARVVQGAFGGGLLATGQSILRDTFPPKQLGQIGAVEETTTHEAVALFQTNFFGVHRLTRAVLPAMRSQGRGRIVTIGSIGGFLPEPFQAFYCSAKYALEGYVESLDYEVRPLGIRAVLVQPGFIRTNLSANRTSATNRVGIYASSRSYVMDSTARDIGNGTPPEAVSAAVEKLLVARNPALRTRVGADAHQLYVIRHLLPPALFRFGMRRRLSRTA